MNSLGICPYNGMVYEGRHTGTGQRIHPSPLLLPVQFSGMASSIAPPSATEFAEELFREDSFDPITRIRRGRIFSRKGQNQPWRWRVQDPLRDDLPREGWSRGTAQCIELTTYHVNPLSDLRQVAVSKYPMVLLGAAGFITTWRIVNIETSLTGAPVLTLKAAFTFNDVPALAERKIPKSSRALLTDALDRVEASLNRLSPIEVIDRCRDALSIAFGGNTDNLGKDLTPAINAYVQSNDSKDDLCSWSGRIVARLHSRGKPNERHNRNVESPTEHHAELAVRCLSIVLTEFGWTQKQEP
jgi:hypothetical protein